MSEIASPNLCFQIYLRQVEILLLPLVEIHMLGCEVPSKPSGWTLRLQQESGGQPYCQPCNNEVSNGY